MKTLRIVALGIFVLALSWPDAKGIAVIYPATNVLTADLNIIPKVIEPLARFGRHVAQRSNVVVIAYQTTEYSPTNSPLMDIYQRADTALVFQASIPRLVAPITVYDIATDGQRIAVTASEGVLPTVYLYNQVGGEWTIESSLHPSGPVWSVSISGDVLICGSSMKALLFERQESEWLERVLTPPVDAPASVKNGFGADVAVDKETVVIGARGEIRSDPGRAYAYIRENQQWRLQAELRPEQNIFTPFGSVVAFEGDTALVSAFPTRFDGGFVYLFKRSAGAWSRIGTLTSNGQADHFGSSLAISGRNLFVGAPWGFGGAVYLFRENGATFDQFVIRYEDRGAPPYPPLLSIGTSISADGNTLLAGADGFSGFADSGGIATMFDLRFGVTLMSPMLRLSDQSFHFRLIEAEPGKTYVLQTVTVLGSEWSSVSEIFAEQTEMQLQVDFSPTSAAAFYQVRLKDSPTGLQ